MKPAWTCGQCRKIAADKDMKYDPGPCRICTKIPGLMQTNEEAFALFTAAFSGLYNERGINHQTIDAVMNEASVPMHKRAELRQQIVAAADAVAPLVFKRQQ